MKVSHAVDNVRSSQGLGETGTFKIEANAHAFKLLSAGMYSDKIKAVLREIGCNARDAHIMADKLAHPIRVKLPNNLSDQFYIQDWGPGLSHEDIMGLYSTYFASTKQTSNDFTGAFGLGSKSPFAYTDSFSVVSTHGGKKRTYTIYLNNKGAPTTSLMTEEDPEPGWESGIRVGFSVKKDDYQQFVEKAQEVYQWFDPLPEIKGSHPIKPVAFKEKRADFWVLDNPADPSLVQAVMGSVAYPLDLKQLGADGSGKTVDLLNFISITSGLVLPIPVGKAMPTPSREALQYDADTLKSVQEMARKAIRRMGQEVVKVLEAAEKGGWAELCVVRTKVNAVIGKDMTLSFNDLGQALGLDKKRAEQLDKYLHHRSLEIPARVVKNSALRLALPYGGGVRLHSLTPLEWEHNGTTYHGAKTHRHSSREDLQIELKTVIAYGTDVGPAARARQAVLDRKYTQVFTIGRDKDHHPKKADTLADAQRLSAALGNMPMIELSALELPQGHGGTKKRRPKGWVPTMDPKAEVPYRDFKTGSANTGVMALGNFDPKVMMCDRSVSKWNNTRLLVREYIGTAEDDKSWDDATWSRIWGAYKQVAQELKLPDTVEDYAFVTAAQIKSNYMVEGGFTSMYQEIVKYVKRDDLRPAMKGKLKKWSPTVPDYIGYGSGWMTYLSHLLHNSADALRELEPCLQKAKLFDTLKAVVDHTKTHPKGTTRIALPPYLESYQYLCQIVGVQSGNLTVDEGVTLEDMDKAFTKRFPLARAITAGAFIEFYKTDNALGTQLLELLLSKE